MSLLRRWPLDIIAAGAEAIDPRRRGERARRDVLACLERREFDEADRRSAQWLALHPTDTTMREFAAYSAHSSGRYAEARERWATLLQWNPNCAMAHAGVASNNRELGALEAAADAIATALTLFPDHFVVLSEAGRIARLIPCDQRSAVIWNAVIAADPLDLDLRLELVERLVAAEKLVEAGSELDRASAVFPSDTDLKVRRFDIALEAGDWLAASRAYRQLEKTVTHAPSIERRVGEKLSTIFDRAAEFRRDQPAESLELLAFLLSYASHQVAWIVAFVDLSIEMGQFARASRELSFAKALHQGVPALSLAGCRIAARQRFWGEALRLLDLHLKTWPDDRDALAQKAVCDHEADAERDGLTSPTPVSGLDDDAQELLHQFQSLGQNCEFGLVQRAFGVEAIALFRYNTTTLQSLSDALSAGLEGIGAPEHTVMSLWEDHEYYLFDRRWGFGFHTFVAKDQVVIEDFYGKICRHLAYLRTKLVEDLRDATKIFVISLDEPTFEPLMHLHAIMQTYGPVRLLCVTPVSQAAALGHAHAAVGDIVELRGNLHVGYMSWLGKGTIGWRILFDEWLKLCRSYVAGPLLDRSGVLVFDGDSIAVSHGVQPGSTLADQVVEALSFTGKVHVVGAGGRPVAECTRRFAELVSPLRRPGPAVIFFHAGDNDIDKGADAGTVYCRLASYIDQAHAAGWTIVVSTELQRYDFPPHWQAELAAYNGAMVANTAAADGVVDFGADPIMGGLEKRTDPDLYQADGVHPTAAGYAILAGATVSELRKHLS